MFSLICTWINGWVNNCEAGDLRGHHAHYDAIVMSNHGIDLIILPHYDLKPWMVDIYIMF